MKEISAEKIRETVSKLCIEANMHLPADVRNAIENACAEEPWEGARNSLRLLVENMEAADEMQLPICQDTGAACVFVEIGGDVRVTGGSIADAVNKGVKDGYEQGMLRKSIVADPLRRTNTGDNTPAFITYDITDGDMLRITVAPKGFGSENMSALKMLKPSDGVEGVIDFVVETVRSAGPNPCPPVILGVGIGGTFDKTAYLAKKALLRPIDSPNPDPYYAVLERTLLEKVNCIGTGPQGFGGRTTCLGVSVEAMPTHVAGLPVAVNISCHATRRATAVL